MEKLSFSISYHDFVNTMIGVVYFDAITINFNPFLDSI